MNVVELGPFFKGAACGSKVREGHQNTEFTSQEQRFAFFWLAAGMLAAGEYDITSLGDENAEFITGVASQAPSFTPTDGDDDE